jgi:ketosteroid isomerase-like protein
MSLREQLTQFIQLVESGQSVLAIERFYADDAVVFENHELARAGRLACAAYEREAVAKQAEPPRTRAVSSACDDTAGRAFVEWLIRWKTPEGTWMRLEEVAAQRWSGDRIVEERFYYEGVIDEGGDDD